MDTPLESAALSKMRQISEKCLIFTKNFKPNANNELYSKIFGNIESGFVLGVKRTGLLDGQQRREILAKEEGKYFLMADVSLS